MAQKTAPVICRLFLALTIAGLGGGAPVMAQQVQQIGSVFIIQLENHNFTQPSSDTSSSLQPILGNAAAPYINSLITPGNANATYVSYATAYHNALASVAGGTGNIHPSEPNYIWQEAGSNYGVSNDNDPYGSGGNVATILSSNSGASPEHLTQLLQIAGISWRSYQEDTNLLNSSGQNFNANGGTLTNNVANSSQYTVPLASFSGSSTSYTNPYNGSNYYGFACKHDGSLFFTDTNGNGVTTTSNLEVSHYAPLQQLASDLSNNTVARYNVITPDLYNDMHNGIPGGFNYHGTLFTNDQANIAQGDNFLSIIIPQIMASQAFQNNGLIIIWTDESEGTSPNDYNHCMMEIVISPLAKGNGYASQLNYTHSSDLATMQRIFGVAAATSSGYLGDAANSSNPNADGSGAAQDLSDMFKPGTVFATLSGLPAAGSTVTGHTLREHYSFSTDATDLLGHANLTAQPTTGNGISYPTSGGVTGGGYLHLSGTGYLLASQTAGSNFSALGDYSTFKPFSLSFWVRQTAAQQTANGATAAVASLTTNSTNSSTYNTGVEIPTVENTTNVDLELRCRNGGGGTSDAGQLDTGHNISDGNWHHVAMTFTANSRYAYIDGAYCGTNNTAISFTTNPIANFAVGALIRAGSMLDQWTGDIADMQVYDGLFSNADAQQLYQNYGQTVADNEVTTTPTSTTPADVVDPMIGVAGGAGTGENAPGACLPQSSIYPSPDTSSVGPGGYIPGSNVVGFSQLHASGAGASVPSFGNFLITPRIGNGITEASGASAISNIVAHPYEFSCNLSTWNINCAVAPTAHSAIYEFDFPASSSGVINIDVARKIGSSTGMSNGSVTIDPVNGIISGGGTYSGNWNPAPYNVYFYAMVDTTPATAGTWLGSTSSSGVYTQSTTSAQSMGGYLNYSTGTSGTTVHLKIAVSFESVAAAQQYLQNEIPGWDVSAVAQNARTQWNNTLASMQIPGSAAADQRLFYTALFHSFITPRNRTGDQATWPAGMPFWDDQYTNWDTWQTLFPLLDIISPPTVASIVNSYGARYLQNGRAETVFTQGKDYQAGQGGDEVDRVIGDAYVKGIPGINWQNAWNLLQSHANRRTTDYLSLGYVSEDGSIGGYDSRMHSGSGTIAFASDDWCAAQVAAGLGFNGTAQTLLARSSSWKNVWDPTDTDSSGFKGFIRGRYESGAFDTQAPSTNGGSDFYEGSAWNYSFNIYHDHDGMVALMGGRNRFVQRLEFALAQRNSNYIDWTNEPAFQETFLFSYANRPYLASYWTDQFRQLFTSYNYPGDDDSGAMSSLYIFMTSGLYPIATQDYYYLFGSRLPSVQFVPAGGGNTFTVTSSNASNQNGQNVYVQSATLNGQPLNSAIIHHSDIVAGSTLNFVMGAYPTTWGCGADLQPPVLDELVLPVAGPWTAGLGSPQISGASSSSPTWTNAGNTAIYSTFPQVALGQAGDSITLGATVQIQGLTATGGASANLFSWGLFSSAGQSGVTGWPGYLAANDTDSSSTQWFASKASGSTAAYYSATGASQLESFALPTPAFNSDTYYLVMTLTLNSSNAIDYVAALVRASDGTLFASFTGSDATPPSLVFDTVGLRLGTSAQASAINVTNCAIVGRRTSYSGRSLVVPSSGQFISAPGVASGANFVVNSGAVFASATGGVGSISAGGVAFSGGSLWNENLSTDGSSGGAGSTWDTLTLSGALDLSGASDSNPVTLHLISLSGAAAAGAIASWNPNVNHIWTGIASAAGGVTNFDAQKFVIDLSAFASPVAGTFSVQLGQGGTRLDLVYTSTTNIGTGNSGPTVVSAASASPSTVTGATTSLSVRGDDAGGASGLTYTWVATTLPSGAATPTFSANGTNAAQNTTATFSTAGTYTLMATITDAGGLSATSNVNVTVNQTLTGVAVTPPSSTVGSHATQQFSATATDQFGKAMASQPTFAWSSTGSGSVNTTGLYTGSYASGAATVSATGAGLTGTANVAVTDAPPVVATAASGSVSGSTVSLSVLGADSDGGGESNLTYTWAATATPSSATAPTYSANGTNAAKTSTVTIGTAGNYTFTVTIADMGGLSVTSSVNVTVVTTASGVWSAASGGSWTNSANWSGGVIASGSGSTADFSTLSLPADATVTLDSTLTIGNLKFGDISVSHNWFLNTGSGGPLSLSVGSGTPAVTVNNQTTTIGAVLSGSLGLSKAGAGTLVLTGANNYAGSTTVSAGVMSYTGAGASSGGGSLSVGGSSAAFNANSSGALSFSTIVAGTSSTAPGAINVSAGTLNLTAGTSYITAGNSGYGYISVSGGAVNSNNASGLRVGNGTGTQGVYFQSGGTVTLSRYLALNSPAATPATATITGGSLIGSTSYDARVGDNGGAGVLNIGTLAGGTGTLKLQGTSGIEVGGAATGGTGTLNLDGGAILLTAGSIQQTSGTGVLNLNGGTIQSGANNLTLVSSNLSSVNVYKGGVTIDTQANTATVAAKLNAVANSGVYPAGGVILVSSGNGGSGYIGAPIVTVSGGSGSGVMAIANVTGGVITGVTITNPGTGYMAGDKLTFAFTGGGATTAAASYQYTLQAADVAANGGGGLVKIGTGALTLTGTSTYSGATTINNGTLSVTGSISNSAVTVNNGGTLAGNGKTGAVTVASGGTLAPGVSGTGSLNLNSNALLLAGTTSMQVNASTSAATAVQGISSVTYGGTLTVTKASGTFAAGNMFTLFSATSYSGNFASLNLPALPAGLYWNTANLAVNGSISVIGQTLTFISVSPSSASLRGNGTQQFSAIGYDQFSNPMVTPPSFAWTNNGVGSINGSGLYTASSTSGTATVTAASGSVSGMASVTVNAKPYDSWQAQAFGSNASNPTVAGPTANPSGDGIANLLKYAFNADPNVSDRGVLPISAVSGGNLVLTYLLNDAATDLTYTVEQSTDLMTWTPANPTQTNVSDSNGTSTIQASVPMNGATHLWLRLSVTQQ